MVYNSNNCDGDCDFYLLGTSGNGVGDSGHGSGDSDGHGDRHGDGVSDSHGDMMVMVIVMVM